MTHNDEARGTQYNGRFSRGAAHHGSQTDVAINSSAKKCGNAAPRAITPTFSSFVICVWRAFWVYTSTPKREFAGLENNRDAAPAPKNARKDFWAYLFAPSALGLRRLRFTVSFDRREYRNKYILYIYSINKAGSAKNYCWAACAHNSTHNRTTISSRILISKVLLDTRVLEDIVNLIWLAEQWKRKQFNLFDATNRAYVLYANLSVEQHNYELLIIVLHQHLHERKAHYHISSSFFFFGILFRIKPSRSDGQLLFVNIIAARRERDIKRSI